MNALSLYLRNLKMETIPTKLIAAGILFLLTLVSGTIVSNSERPLSVITVTIHKLIAVGAIVLTGMAVNQLYKTADGNALAGMIFIAASGIFVLGLIATGALLTREEMQLPDVVLKIHQAAPLLALVSSAAGTFLLGRGNW